MNAKEISKEQTYWDSFYLENSNNRLFSIPSQFCCLMATEITTGTCIAEFGCGNGRDSIFLARHGFNVVAMDLSIEAIKQNNLHTQSHDSISFHCGDVSSQKDVYFLISEARKNSKTKNITVYSRFFLHSLDEEQENAFIKFLSEKLIKGDQLYFEFRTSQDLETKKIYENHFRRFVIADDFLSKLTQYNFKVKYHIEGTGMAKYKDEDPVVARFIATKA
jgi:SAM-dependent methyltransferase